MCQFGLPVSTYRVVWMTISGKAAEREPGNGGLSAGRNVKTTENFGSLE